VSPQPEPRLARSREELAAARVLFEREFYAQAVSRAYYGAFYAAVEALRVLGETRSKHSGVIAAFVQLVVRGGGVDEAAGRALRSLFEQRSTADYGGLPFEAEQAREALKQASEVVAAVERWLTERSGTSDLTS